MHTLHEKAPPLPYPQGTLLFRVDWLPEGPASGPAGIVEGGATSAASDQTSGTTTARRVAAQAVKEEHGLLRLTIKRAQGLLAADLNGKSDPYVVALSGGVQRKSKVVKATLDPIWNETLDLPGVLGDFQASGLSLHAYDWDRLSADDPLGSVHIPLDELSGSAALDYIERLTTKGTLYFRVAWVPLQPTTGTATVGTGAPALSGGSDGTLRVLLLKGVELKAADLNGKSDPYVKVLSGGQKGKSKIIKANLNPIWNEWVELQGTLDSFLASGLTLKVLAQKRAPCACARAHSLADAHPLCARRRSWIGTALDLTIRWAMCTCLWMHFARQVAAGSILTSRCPRKAGSTFVSLGHRLDSRDAFKRLSHLTFDEEDSPQTGSNLASPILHTHIARTASSSTH